MDECRGRERGQHKVGGLRLTESPGMGKRAAGQERQTLRAQVNAEEQQEWTRDLGRGLGGGQGQSKVMHELTSSSHKSKNQEWIHDGRSIEVEWLVESLYSSQGEGEGEREGRGSLLLPGKYTWVTVPPRQIHLSLSLHSALYQLCCVWLSVES